MNTIKESQMPVQPYPVNLLRLTLLVIGAILTFVTGASLLGQQPPVRPLVTVAPAVTAPAPQPSVLFERPENAPGTIAAAQEASVAAAQEGENHVIVVSTLVLVLGIVILVLLIAH